jgi:EAL domain-containing protein (putative c-di-GMP-specific phosphodiesterase class I)
MFELSETSALTGAYPVEGVLEKLRHLGVKIAIDRFGTGGSSLPALLDLPATHVKISSEFVQDMIINERAAAVVRLAVELGRSSDLQVIALGVPSDDHVEALTRLGCHLAQGRHLAAPMQTSMLRGYLDSAPALPPPPDADVIDLDSRRQLTPPR